MFLKIKNTINSKKNLEEVRKHDNVSFLQNTKKSGNVCTSFEVEYYLDLDHFVFIHRTCRKPFALDRRDILETGAESRRRSGGADKVELLAGRQALRGEPARGTPRWRPCLERFPDLIIGVVRKCFAQSTPRGLCWL